MPTRVQACRLETASPRVRPSISGPSPASGEQRAVRPQSSSQAVQPLGGPTKLEVSPSGAEGRPLWGEAVWAGLGAPGEQPCSLGASLGFHQPRLQPLPQPGGPPGERQGALPGLWRPPVAICSRAALSPSPSSPPPPWGTCSLISPSSPSKHNEVTCRGRHFSLKVSQVTCPSLAHPYYFKSVSQL